MRLTEAHRGGSRHPKGKTGPLPLYLGCSSQQPPSRPCTAFDHADRSPRAVWRPTRNARLYSTLASRVQAATPLATVATASLRGSKGPSTVAHLRRLLCRRVATRAAMPSRPRRPAAQGASRVRTSVENSRGPEASANSPSPHCSTPRSSSGWPPALRAAPSVEGWLRTIWINLDYLLAVAATIPA